MTIAEIISSNIRQRRKELNLSQLILAEKTDLSTGMIAGIETCKVMPSLDSLVKIAGALALKPYQLLLDEDDKKPFNAAQFHRDFNSMLEQEIGRMENALQERIKNYTRG